MKMNNEEAKVILDEYLSSYKSRTFNELLELLEEGQQFEVTAPSGKEYQIEIQALWDDNLGGDLRIIISIDDGWWRAYFPLTSGFVVSPETE
jgi:hypothetical protein